MQIILRLKKSSHKFFKDQNIRRCRIYLVQLILSSSARWWAQFHPSS